MRYLRNSDYLFKIQQYDLDTLLDGNDELVIDAENKALNEIQLFLRKRYDLTQLFQVYPDYVSGLTYGTGSTVWFNTSTGDTQYLYSPTGSTNSSPITNNWQRSDQRYPLIVDWMTSVALYKLHCRVAPDNVPTQRNDQYSSTIMMLKMIRDETVSVDFPEVVSRIQNIYITGSTSTQSGQWLW